MTIVTFVAAWTLRSAVVALSAAVLLKLFRVKDPSVRLAAWTAALAGSLLIPALTATMPAVRFPEVPGYGRPTAAQDLVLHAFASPMETAPHQTSASPASPGAAQPVRWPAYVFSVYCLGAALLLMRLATGLLLTRGIIRRSHPTGRCLPGGLPIHESVELAVPAALGLFCSVVMLPTDWREWDDRKLEAILAHEQSHVRRRDPAVQLLSAVHRALLWHSPLSWWMHNRIARLAEEVSDAAALAATHDRVSYAETLLQFMQRGIRVAHWEGVAMARYGKADDRIHRILDGTTISHGLTQLGLAAILLLGVPVVFLAAAASPQPPQAPAAPSAPSAPPEPPLPPQVPRSPVRGKSRVTRYLIVSGDSWSGSWEGRDEWRYKKWRAQYGSDYAWFRQDGHDYIVNDEHTMAEFQNAMAPQREVNRQQEEVNRHQEEVNRQQEQVNSHQEDVNRAQEEVNRQQSLVNERSGDQERVNRLQTEVNGKQQTVNAQQEKVNQQQEVVNREQEAVNKVQTRVSAEIENALQGVFDSARRQGLAHEVR